MWPAMLLAVGLEPPQHVFAHGFFTIDGQKMSKTLGNVISPLELSEKYGNDALRAGLLSSFEFGNDGDFSLQNFDDFYRTKLAGGVGNLFNRVIILMHKFLDGEKPSVEISNDTFSSIEPFEKHLEKKQIKAAIDYFFEVVQSANQLMNETEVWKLAKTDAEAAKMVFARLLRKLEILVEMAEVILPESQDAMKKMLGDGEKVGKAVILFDRK